LTSFFKINKKEKEKEKEKNKKRQREPFKYSMVNSLGLAHSRMIA
jgi:hypothetical protein